MHDIKRKSKYNSQKVEFDGITFDSKDECEYYKLLKNKVLLREIKSFSLQPKVILIDNFVKDGIKYAQMTYTPDFFVMHNNCSLEYIDIKGFGTQQGDLRRKLFHSRYPQKLTWLSKNIKYGDENGWIDYDELIKVRKKAKKLKGK